MTPPFHKFPSTPHLAWLGSDDLRGDKLLSPADAAEFLSNEVVIEEKIDGANLGITRDPTGQLHFQNRGDFLTGQLTGQWKPLRGWAANHYVAFQEHLPAEITLFGEWCYAKHSIPYHRLSDLFLAFDCYDHKASAFWSTNRRNELCHKLGLFHVPLLQKSQITMAEATQLAQGPSRYANQEREGIYLRLENDDVLEERAKIVAPAFTQAIEEHWSRAPIEANQIKVPVGKSLRSEPLSLNSSFSKSTGPLPPPNEPS